MTGARGSRDAAEHLVDDALAVLDLDEVRVCADGSWLDLGTGNGVPGVPLLLALPRLRMTLLDSVKRKCEFVATVVEELDLGARARVECARSERSGAHGSPDREAYAAVVAKAVGPLATLVELAAPLLAPGGVLLAYKGERAAAASRRSRARPCRIPSVPCSRRSRRVPTRSRDATGSPDRGRWGAERRSVAGGPVAVRRACAALWRSRALSRVRVGR